MYAVSRYLLVDVMLVIHLWARHLALHIDDLWWLADLNDLLRHLWHHHLPLHRGRHGTHGDWTAEGLARRTACVHLTHLIHSEPRVVLCMHCVACGESVHSLVIGDVCLICVHSHGMVTGATATYPKEVHHPQSFR